MNSPRYRITFLLDRPTLSGGVRVIADYACHLIAQGHDVRLVARPVKRPRFSEKLRAAIRGRPAPRGRGVTTFLDPLGERVSYLPDDRPAQARDVPDGDIVVATFWTTAEIVASLPPSKGVKAYFMQDYGSEGQPIEELRRTWSLGMETITINSALKASVEMVSGQAVHLVPCGVEPLFVREGPRTMRDGPATVGFVFSNNAMKGSRCCIEAIEKARARIPDLRAISFGPLPPKGAAQTVPDFIDFRAGISDGEARATYEAADIWLFGSFNEGFGLPILEAMACGTPVVAARSAAAPDILLHGGGRLVDIGDPDQMASAIVEIASLNGDGWTALSRRAQQTAARYSQAEARRKFEAALIAAAQGARFVDPVTPPAAS